MAAIPIPRPADPAALQTDPIAPLKARTNPYVDMCRLRRRRLRIKQTGMAVSSTCFHLMSRTCGGTVFFDDTEKEGLVLVLRRLAAFCGIKLITYCVMGNHFHALVRVPNREEWLKRFDGPDGEDKFFEHLRTLYSKGFVELFLLELDRLRKDGRDSEANGYVDAMKARFCDISVFCKEVKSRFCKWYNKRHQRRGTLWMERFKSVLVEGKRGDSGEQRAKSQLDALRVMAAYIDLNPVRAKMVKKASEYRWSGWGAALEGNKQAITGLCDVTETKTAEWETEGRRIYGRWLVAAEDWEAAMRRREGATVESEVSEEAEVANYLMQTVRAFTRGVAVGSEAFVEAIFQSHRPHFGPRRETGGRRLDGDARKVVEGLRTLRDLRSKRQPDR
jgi:putative transposase